MTSKTLQAKYAKQYPWIKNAVTLPHTNQTIIELDPSLLSANPKNWRIHSQRQRSTYTAFKSKYGWSGFLTFNLRSGKLLDGHMRLDEAYKSKEAVPVILKDLCEEEENEFLATLDNIAPLAQRNTAALNSLIKASEKTKEKGKLVRTETERKLAQLRVDLEESLESEDASKPLLPQAKKRLRPSLPETPSEENNDEDALQTYRPTEEVFSTTINSNAIFPGETDMGIPSLLPERIATPDLLPHRTYCKGDPDDATDSYFCYSQQFYAELQPGTIGFYTEDWRFTELFSNPEGFLDWLQNYPSIKSLVGPDYSCFPRAWPLVMNLYNVYKSRWCSRLWQEAGYNVIPSIQILDPLPLPKKLSYTFEYILNTLPNPCPTVAFQIRGDKTNPKSTENIISLINDVVNTLKPHGVLLYAGEEKQKYIHGHLTPKSGKTKIEYVYLPQVATIQKRKRNR